MCPMGKWNFLRLVRGDLFDRGIVRGELFWAIESDFRASILWVWQASPNCFFLHPAYH